jgi:hypothetical protein
MTVHLRLPAEIESRLRSEIADLDVEVTECFALELFRRGQLTHYELSTILGLDRFETDAYLKRHNVFEGSLTLEDLELQDRIASRLIAPANR